MQTRPQNRLPDWRNIAAVLEKKIPSRQTLFELFLNKRLIQSVSGINYTAGDTESAVAAAIRTNDLLGYDYVVQLASDYHFPTGETHRGQTISLNDVPAITDRESFDKYPWPDADECDDTALRVAEKYLPDGMKLMIWSADGLLETVTRLLGYDNLCFLLYDDEQLVSDVFERVGAGYLKYFKRCVTNKNIMALVSSDDWGFNTQTMLAPDMLRKYLFPWQREYVKLAHEHGKFAVLHSCGCYKDIIADVIDMGFDARHSYEDSIVPVEQAYQALCGKIAVLGGIDMDFITRSSSDSVSKRARALLEQTAVKGGYALGSGNSIADYVPEQNFEAMISEAWH